MPLIDDLRGKYKGEEIHIIGTGPSAKFLPLQQMLKGKITIGLNLAFEVFDARYNLSIHPEIIARAPNLNWITKIKGNLKLPWQQYYLFQNNQDVHDFSLVESPESGKLYVGRGIHTAAVVLAAEMGAVRIYLYGIDCNYNKTLHHCVQQHTQFYGLSPVQVYAEYYENLVVLRERLYQKYKCYLIQTSAILGIGYDDAEFQHLMNLHNLSYPASSPVELKNYTRPQDKFL